MYGVEPNTGEVWEPEFEFVDDGRNCGRIITNKPKRIEVECLQCGGVKGDKECPLCKDKKVLLPFGMKGNKHGK